MNCQQGDIAKIIRSEAGNEGRQVVVLHRIGAAEANAILGPGFAGYGSLGPLWLIQPLQPLRQQNAQWQMVRLSMEKQPFPDAWLRPIRGEPIADDIPADIAQPQTA